MNAERAVFFQGERREMLIRLTMNNRPLAVDDKTLALQVRKYQDESPPIIDKADLDFNKVYADQGVVLVTLEIPDLAEDGHYRGQLQVVDVAGMIRKSKIFDIFIEEALVGRVLNLITSCLGITSASEPELS